MRAKVYISIFSAVMLTSASSLFSQTKLSIQSNSKLWLEGNSTLHKYSATTADLSGTISVDSLLFADGKTSLSKPFEQVEITIPVKRLLSGNEKLDNNMYEALKANDYPNITYRMISDSLISSVEKDSMTLKTTGKLSVAGKEKVVDIIITAIKKQDNTLSIKGSQEFLMTDFEVAPPSMMLGLLKTDNKVVIHFDVQLKPQQ